MPPLGSEPGGPQGFPGTIGNQMAVAHFSRFVRATVTCEAMPTAEQRSLSPACTCPLLSPRRPPPLPPPPSPVAASSATGVASSAPLAHLPWRCGDEWGGCADGDGGITDVPEHVRPAHVRAVWQSYIRLRASPRALPFVASPENRRTSPDSPEKSIPKS